MNMPGFTAIASLSGRRSMPFAARLVASQPDDQKIAPQLTCASGHGWFLCCWDAGNKCAGCDVDYGCWYRDFS